MRDPVSYSKIHSLIGPALINPGAETSTDADAYVDMTGAEFGEVTIMAVLTDTKTAIGQVTIASDAAGTGKADLTGATVTLTGASGDLEQVGRISFNIHDVIGIDADKYFIGVDVTTNQNSDLISASLRLSGTDYKSA